MNDSNVGVIIVNWNLPSDTIICARSVLASEGVSTHIVIVDNGSTDDSALQLRSALPMSTILSLPENIGFAGGINAGLKYLYSKDVEYVLLLNNDTYLASDCISHLLATLTEDRRAAIAGPLIFYADNPEYIWYFGDREKFLWPVPLSLMRGKPYRDQVQGAVEVDYVSGCAMLVRFSVFKSLCEFDERLFMHYEDADFCWRVRDAGWKIYSVPDARMWHKVSVSSRHLGSRINYYRLRNRIWFYATHRRGFYRSYALAYVLLQELIRYGYAALFKGQKTLRLYRRAVEHGMSGKLGKWNE